MEADIQVYADEHSLNTILRNLVSNAIKYTSEGGKVSITAQQTTGNVTLVVNDTGTGISAEKVGSLFTIKKKSEAGTRGEKGTGLGLNIVKELIDLNKGEIAVDSTLNIGTRFQVHLPSI